MWDTHTPHLFWKISGSALRHNEESWLEYFLLRETFFQKLFSKNHIIFKMPPQIFFLLTKKDLSELGLSFLFLLERLVNWRHSYWYYVVSWKHSEVPGFQNKHKFSNLFWNSESCCETSLLYCRDLFKILNKSSLFLYIHNCTGDGGEKCTTAPQYSPTQS